MARARILPILALAATLLAGRPSPAVAQLTDPIVARGVEYLKAYGATGDAGESALAALAMLKAEVPPDDPAVRKALVPVFARFEQSAYKPQKGSGGEIYEAAVVLLALATLDPVAQRDKIAAAAQFLLNHQYPNGCWDYSGRGQGDTSISQYALLGLWEAENAGIPVPPSAWDRAATFMLTTQRPSGGWVYHPGESAEETLSTTAAGVGSVLICARQLAPYRVPERVKHPLLIPLVPEGERKRFTPEASPQRMGNAIRSGIAWIGSNFNLAGPVAGHSPYYGLYGIERIGALADAETLGRVNWFDEGRRYIQSTQQAGGSFNGGYGVTPNTAWAVLFVSKSTAKTLRKIQVRRLGAGTLIGGRGLPRDLSSISVAGGRVVARPMDGAIEGMLAVLEDPRVEDAGSALAGLIARYQAEGPKALRPFEDRFRKLLRDPDQGVRRVAAWSLARTADLAMAPPLIDALNDPDDAVVGEARAGLQLLSRKIEGLGPAPGATPGQKAEAIARWRAWYESLRAVADAAEPDPGTASKGAGPARRGP